MSPRPRSIVIYRETHLQPEVGPEVRMIPIRELGQWIQTGAIWKHLGRYRHARLVTWRADTMTKPFFACLAVRLLSRGECYIEEQTGSRVSIGLSYLFKLFSNWVRDALAVSGFIRSIHHQVEKASPAKASDSPTSLDLTGTPVYLRTDITFALQAGGSVGHTTGVLHNLEAFSAPPVLLTTFPIPTLRPEIEWHLLPPPTRFQDFPEVSFMYHNRDVENFFHSVLKGRTVSFLYQRYSVFNFAGVALARSLGVPLVLEYNGSEMWVGRHWGQPYQQEALGVSIEHYNVKQADVVVVVSQPLMNQLVDVGVERECILVNPNGVAPEMYSPEIDGMSIREKYGLGNTAVLGFIGTFGRWHGAEVLAHAYGLLLDRHPEYRERTRLMLVGDGLMMPQVKEQIERWNLDHNCILTGLVPQVDGPQHLAACDVLVSPHVPNPDGTPFFGSPTKLFEYMAMGKGIVASDLDQIGEVLEHNRTAWLVRPGDPQSLMEGMKRLINEDDLRQRLGNAARQQAVAHHTWKEHTRRIIDKLKERCACR